MRSYLTTLCRLLALFGRSLGRRFTAAIRGIPAIGCLLGCYPLKSRRSGCLSFSAQVDPNRSLLLLVKRETSARQRTTLSLLGWVGQEQSRSQRCNCHPIGNAALVTNSRCRCTLMMWQERCEIPLPTSLFHLANMIVLYVVLFCPTRDIGSHALLSRMAAPIPISVPL